MMTDDIIQWGIFPVENRKTMTLANRYYHLPRSANDLTSPVGRKPIEREEECIGIDSA